MGSKKGMNVVMGVGNLGKDAELKYSPNGKPVLTFSVAATTGFGEYEHTEWFNCVMFGDRTEKLVPFLKKGQLVGLTGSLQTRTWDDDQGQKHWRTEVKINDLTLLGSNGNGNGTNGGGNTDQAASQAPEEEIPF
jgi:single-strand DNA-binding protein